MSRFSDGRAATPRRSKSFWLTLLATVSVAASVPSARAAITPGGDVSPSDPSTWDYYSTDAYIGNTANGTLTLDAGNGISSHLGYIGYESAAIGAVNISGTNSSWRTYGICVGGSGNGTLSLAGGGRLTMGINHENNSSYIGYNPGSTGLVSVDGPGSTLTNEIDLYVGNSGSGTISVTNGGRINSALNTLGCDIYIGYGSGSNGAVTVDGASSTWRGYGTFRVGWSGNGTLSITNGASVNASETWVGVNSGSTGLIDFGANGGTLTTGSLYASPTQLTGTGTIVANGLVSDVDLRFDSTHGLQQTISWQQSGQNITLNLNKTGTAGALGAGWKGAGSLSIRDGVTVSSSNAYLGYGSGSTGVATVSGSGSVWNVKSVNEGLFHVGNRGNGTLSITNGGRVGCTSVYSYIGNFAGSSGAVTVDGAGSTWNSDRPIYVGNSGNGTLSITNGASVNAAETCVGMNSGSTGSIDFGPNGGTLTTGSLLASTTQLTGTGTIIATGLVSDINLKFDASHGLEQVIPLQQPGQNITLRLDATGMTATLGAGWKGQGSLAIQDGIAVKSSDSYLGWASGSTGAATVSGSGSTWDVHYGSFDIGHGGSGTLLITHGGTVTFGYQGNQCRIGALPGANGAVVVNGVGSQFNVGPSAFAFVGGGGSGTLSIINGGSASGPIYIGYDAGSKGVVTVDGPGSNWSSSSLLVGSQGSGTLSISGGGTVAATGVSVGNSPSLLAIDVGRGSSLVAAAGTGGIVNNGSIRILAGAGVPADGTQYSPISASTWSGIGTYQPVGGTWDATNHKFTASSVNPGTSGSAVSLNLACEQRALVSDIGTDKTGWVVGASFLSAATETDMTFTATPITDTVLDALTRTAGRNQEIMSGWIFSTVGYDASSDKPIYLSFDVGTTIRRTISRSGTTTGPFGRSSFRSI